MKTVCNIVLAVLAFLIKSEVILAKGIPFQDNAFSEFKPSSRIADGLDVFNYEAPYQAGLVVNRAGAVTWCSGAIISNSSILTTARCVGSATFVDVYLGALNIRNLTEPGRINQRVPGVNVTVHSDFDQKTGASDIAIIRLPQAIPKFTSTIFPIELPTRSASNNITDEILLVYGWGSTDKNGEWGVAERLQVGVVSVSPVESCERFYGSAYLPSNFCARSLTGVPCSGDLGDTAGINGILHGLVSEINRHRCDDGVLTLYTRVSYFLDWIADNSDVLIGS